MANWLSSKLKVAETLLQQIDQQAADSLRKNEKYQFQEESLDTAAKSGGSLPLKDQLKRKTTETIRPDADEEKHSSEGVANRNNNTVKQVQLNRDAGKGRADTTEPSSKTNPEFSAKTNFTTLTDSDWTEILATPNPSSSNLGGRRSNGSPSIHSLKKGGKKGNAVANLPELPVSESKNSRKSSNRVKNRTEKLNMLNQGKELTDELGNVEKSGYSERFTNADVHMDSKNTDGKGVSQNYSTKKPFLVPRSKDSEEKDESIPPLKAGNDGRKTALKRNVARDSKNKSSTSMIDSESSSDSESDSTTDSEREREREERRRKREKILAEQMAAKAVEAIRERENMIATLEGEKQSLEKILDERAKQQVQEASELQTSMMETMEAAELEKQKHNNTRMQLLEWLAGLETTNADLARSLAAAQKRLEVEIDQVTKLRQQIDFKEAAHQEIRRRIQGVHKSGYLDRLTASKGGKFQCRMLEEECSLIEDKVGRLQKKAEKLVEDIELLQKDMEEPTEVEVELKRRLDQLTEHLIKKQAQVEALCSEKATLLFRIEALSRLLEENKYLAGLPRDLESGDWEASTSNLRPALGDKIISGKKHLGSIILQLEAVFFYGTIFLRRNPNAKLLSVIYLVCLHIWVIYIFLSNSLSSTEAESGAVMSLENISNTTGV